MESTSVIAFSPEMNVSIPRQKLEISSEILKTFFTEHGFI
jgi:hypothetical protein